VFPLTAAICIAASAAELAVDLGNAMKGEDSIAERGKPQRALTRAEIRVHKDDDPSRIVSV
jgi:hypothetical protein